jgi:hypothetical protein
MTTPKSSTHGGQRENAGRKPIDPSEPTVRITVRLSQSQYDWLLSQGNISETLRALIDSQMPVPVKNISASS